MSHPDQFFGNRTYAQFGEDLIILNVFHKLGITKGRYFDIGAHHPYNISNTALLYEQGWRGVCVEANPNLIPTISSNRLEDNVLNMGIGVTTGYLDFYMVDDYSGRNSFDKEQIDRFVSDYPEFKVTEVKKIPMSTIEDLFSSFYVPDLLCIDIEGLDYQVIESMKSRPLVICVETEGKSDEFDSLLKSKNYDKLFSTLGNGIYLDATCT